MTIDRLYIFDADATLRVCTVHGQPCPHWFDEWISIPWAKERIARIDWTRNGFGIVSNQAGVAKNYLSEQMAMSLLWSLVCALGFGARVIPLGAIRCCPHASDAGCECRKPKPKMILDVIEAYGVDRERAIYVGDLDTDREAAANAGVEFAWIWDFCGRTHEEWVGWLADQNELHRGDKLPTLMSDWKKTVKIELNEIKGEEWAVAAHALGLSSETRDAYFRYGEYASIEIEVDANLKIVGGRIIPLSEDP